MVNMLPTLAFFSNLGLPELVIILLIALLIFGHKLPSVARSLGSSVSEFKKGVKEADKEAEKEQGQEKQQPGAAGAAPAGAPAAAAAALSPIKCGSCGTTYTPAAIGAPCPGCGIKPGSK